MTQVIIVGIAIVVVGAVSAGFGFVIGRKKGNKIISDLKRRQGEAEVMLNEVKDAADKGRDEVQKVATSVKERWEKITERPNYG